MNWNWVALIKLHDGEFERHIEKQMAKRLPPPEKGAALGVRFRYLLYRTLPYHRKYGWIAEKWELEYSTTKGYFRHGMFGMVQDWDIIRRWQPEWHEDPALRIRSFIINVIPHWLAAWLGWWDTEELVRYYGEMWWHDHYYTVMPVSYYKRKVNWQEYWPTEGDMKGIEYDLDRTYLTNPLLCWIADRMFPPRTDQ